MDSGFNILANPNITLQQSAALIAATPVVSGPPGSSFNYGGLSMQAAGAAAERVAGAPLVDVFAQRILEPLGLRDTRFVATTPANPRIASGLQSTAADFGHFMDMLLNHARDRETGRQVLTPESVRSLLTQQTADTQALVYSPLDNNRYGIGVWLEQLDPLGQPVDALAAGARGFHSWIDLSHELVFVFATDLTSFANVEGLSALMHEAVTSAVPEVPAWALLLMGLALQHRRFLRCS